MQKNNAKRLDQKKSIYLIINPIIRVAALIILDKILRILTKKCQITIC